MDRLACKKCKCGGTCLDHFVNDGLCAYVEYWETFRSLHKLDQDGYVFQLLRSFALSQVVLKFDSSGKLTRQPGKLAYSVMGRRVCREAFTILHGISWHPRAQTILDAVLKGSQACPVDTRYIAKARGMQVSALWGEVHSYIQTLYDSVAETLPEDDSSGTDDGQDTGDIDITDHLDDGQSARSSPAKRKMPPGSIYEQWRQCAETGLQCGYKLFWQVWQRDFGRLLGFRTRTQHATCAVCQKHKLVIKMLGHDVRARARQRSMYDRHLKDQYQDRRKYWFLRSQSRMHTPVICIILDGMDMAKFAWPKDPMFKNNHDWDGFVRPKLHVWGALVHGYASVLFVSHCDTSKGGSTTTDVLAYLLGILQEMGVQLSGCHIHCQLDNTASSNKNNTVLSFLAFMVSAGLLTAFTLGFLRAGHTHEDIKVSTQGYLGGLHGLRGVGPSGDRLRMLWKAFKRSALKNCLSNTFNKSRAHHLTGHS